MAGHSKWANIQHRKGAQDAKRGKLFTKLIREITVAARLGGGDVNSNPRLRIAIDKALSANMTRDTVDRAIKRGAGGLDGDDVEELRYEGYGPGGIAIIVDCMTNNRNRTAGEVRHAFSKGGGNLGTEGSVAYLFAKKGLMSFEPGSDETQIFEVALESGADDIAANDDGSVDVTIHPDEFSTLKTKLESAKLAPNHAEVTWLPALYVDVDTSTAEKLMQLFDLLEDLDDVQNVYSNANMP